MTVNESPKSRSLPKDASTGRKRAGNPQKQGTSEAPFVTTREVWAVLSQDEDVHGEVMTRFRALGGSLDRWQPQDRGFMAESITRVEDQLELRRGAATLYALRMVLRALRRRLEAEVWS